MPLASILKKSKELVNEHGLYGDICNFEKQLLINQQLMDLSNPDIPESDLEEINQILFNEPSKLDKLHFLKLYNEDRLGNSIPNTEIWLNEIFSYLQIYKIK
jgi:hypothetical protein